MTAMGIGYVDSVVVYNRYLNHTMGEVEYYFGTRFDNVRVELTQGANQRASGLENASICTVKIPNNGNLPKPYKAPEAWNDLTTEEMTKNFTLDTTAENFFIVVKKAELGIDIDTPQGLVESDTYMPNGFFEWIKNKYGYVFGIDTVDVYNVIPRFEIGGK